MKKNAILFLLLLLPLSVPLFLNGGLTARADSQPAAFNPADWNGKKISAVTGTIFDQIILDNIPGAVPTYFNNNADGLEALKNGKIDAIIDDDAAVRLYAAKNPRLKMLEPFVTTDNYAVVAAKGNDALLAQLNAFIAQIKSDGTYDDMLKRWLDTADPPPMPAITEGGGATLNFATSGIVDGFSYYKDGEINGFDVEFAKRFASYADMKLNITIMDFGALIPSVQSGKSDFAASLFTVTDERKKSINFTDPYYTGGAAIAVYDAEAAAVQKDTFWSRLETSFQNNLIKENRWTMLLSGLEISIVITVFAFILATLLGFGVCGLRMSGNPVLNFIGNLYVTVFRGTPLVVLLMIVYYIIFGKISISGTIVAIIAFGVNGAAFIGEIIRTSILTIDKGQVEAARSMGFSKAGAFFTVTFPQAVRTGFPVYMSEFISMFKMTSVVGYIAILDLTKAGDIIRSRTYDAFFPLIVVALVYLIVSSLLVWLFNLINRKTNKRLRRGLKG